MVYTKTMDTLSVFNQTKVLVYEKYGNTNQLLKEFKIRTCKTRLVTRFTSKVEFSRILVFK